ncbi:MAG: Ig-like domain-containing protein [Bradymonadaceae bacterium]
MRPLDSPYSTLSLKFPGAMAGILGLVTLLACSPFSGFFGDEEPPEAAAPIDDRPLCGAASLTATAAAPFDDLLLDVQTSQGTIEHLFAEVHARGHEDLYYAPIRRDEQGSFVLITPFHPDGINGGRVQIRIMGTEFECPGIHDLDIRPLSPAPGTLAASLQKSVALIELQARALGFELEDLRRDDLSDLPAPLWGLAVSLAGLDAPDNPYSIARVVAGQSPTSPKLDEGMEFAEALLAKLGLLDVLDAEFEAYQSLGEPPEPLRFERAASYSTRVQALCGAPLQVAFGSAEELSYYMQLAHINSESANPDFNNALDGLLAGVSLVGGPAAQAAASLISLVTLFERRTREAFARTLPSIITGKNLTISMNHFNEDSEEQGRWSNYTVTPSSQGWNTSALMLDMLLEAISNVKAGKGLSDSFTTAVDGGSIIILVAEGAEAAAGNAAIDWLEENGAADNPCNIPPYVWGPIDLSNKKWVERSYRGAIKAADRFQGSVQPGDDHPYEPHMVGPGVVAIHANTALFPPGRNELSSMETGRVRVAPIQVALHPSFGSVEPGKTMQISGTVFNARDKRLVWEIVSGGGALRVRADGRSAVLTAPASEEDFPVVIRARSRARTGLRNPARFGAGFAREEREAFGFYRDKSEVKIVPGNACVKPGESRQFDAYVTGDMDDDSVRWSTTGGEIDENGVFTGTSTGRFRITAKSNANSRLEDTARVTVGDCRCSWEFQVRGPLFFSASDILGVVGGVPPSSDSLALTLGPGNAKLQIRAMDIPGAGPGIIGSFPVDFTVFLPETTWLGQTMASFPDNPGVLHIHTWGSDHHLTATFAGTAMVFASIIDEDPIYVDVSARVSTYVQHLGDFTSFANNCGEDD